MSEFRGPVNEIRPGKFRRDSRTPKEKFQDMMESPEGFITVIGLMLALFFILPAFGEFWLLISIYLLLKGNGSTKKVRLPFRMPKTSNIIDLSQVNPGTNKPMMAEGITFFGNEIGTKKELWFNNSDMRTHVLIFGSTGAGKTEALLSLSYNALVQGSGLIYVDGKGENTLYTKVYTLARTMGREDDILVINYMTGSRDVFGPQEFKLSNTLNPFTSGSSGGLTEMIVSLMDGAGGGGDMWKGRAISLISAVIMALVYLRDEGEILLDVEKIREYLSLVNIIDLYKRKDLPHHVKEALKGYLVSLPGFDEKASKQSETVGEQHGYLQMQFTRTLGSLADSYGFIYKTNLGEVDFRDVVLNRRILVVLLPALEKSKDELASLGKIIIACVKQMMASALGSDIEGSYSDVVETKPTNSDMPFMTVFDEYGYYAVEGSAVMPAQARSLGFSMIFAGQDLPAFEKASKEEAASIVANCNIKICMKLEDPHSTYDLFEKAAGETLAPSIGSLELQSGMLSSAFVPTKNLSLDMKKRINVLDLKEQLEGDAHILFKSALVRGKMFYANPSKPPYIRVNYFVKVEAPDESEVNDFYNKTNNIYKNISNISKIQDLEEFLEIEESGLSKLVDLVEANKDKSLDEKFISVVYEWSTIEKNKYIEELESFEKEEVIKENINTFSSNKKMRDEDYVKNLYKLDNDNDDGDEDDEDDEGVENIFLSEEDMRSNFEMIEGVIGETEESAKGVANKAIDNLKEISNYPGDTKPEGKEPEEIMDILKELDEAFSENLLDEN